MPAAFTHTTAPTLWRAAVISASRNKRARPPLPTQSAASRVSPSTALTWMLPRKRMTYRKPKLSKNSNNLTSPKPRSARTVTATPSGSSAFRRDKHRSSKSLRWFFNSSLSTVSQRSGVALPWPVTRCSASVDWLSASKSVQSIATTISRRAPTTSRIHEPNKSQGTTPALLSNRSTCLIADLANSPRACASACPIKETASVAPVMTPSVPLAKQIGDEYTIQEFMNKIKTLPWRSHRFPSRLILHSATPKIRYSGFFESRKMGGFIEVFPRPAALWSDDCRPNSGPSQGRPCRPASRTRRSFKGIIFV